MKRRLTAQVRNRREGFTLIELVSVVVIIGLLAAIGLTRFWGVKERAYVSSLKYDLRTAAVQQERYFERSMAYANDEALLPDYDPSPGVTVRITWNTPEGWAATATHISWPNGQCGYFTGPAPANSAPPATESGKVTCND